MKIRITEEKERAFIPYKIVIEIDSESDHKALIEGARKFRDKDSYFFRDRSGLSKLGELILNHVPK